MRNQKKEGDVRRLNHRHVVWRIATAPIRDRAGRIDALRAVMLGLLLAPAAVALWLWLSGGLDPRTYVDLNHRFGLWALRFFLLSLAISPLRTAFGWTRGFSLRRMIGVGALFYLIAHLAFYFIDLGGNPAKFFSEIALRWYLTIGLAAFLMMVALGLTSFDGVIRRMGAQNWKRLHRLVHVIAPLALLHFFMQGKLQLFEAAFDLGVWLILEGLRILPRQWARRTAGLGASVLAAAVLTALAQAGYFALFTGIKPGRVLMANFSLRALSPAVAVLLAGLAVVIAEGVFRIVGRIVGRWRRA